MHLYKLTDSDGYARRGQTTETLWGENVTHKATGGGKTLCADGLIHAYESSLVAVFMNPIHANIANPILWVCETNDVPVRDGQLSCSVRTLTTVKQIELPVITTLQRVEIGIRAALTVSVTPSFRIWAEKWLSGEDRSSAVLSAWMLSAEEDWVRWVGGVRVSSVWAEWAMAASETAAAAASASWSSARAEGDLDLIQIIESVIINKEEKCKLS